MSGYAVCDCVYVNVYVVCVCVCVCVCVSVFGKYDYVCLSIFYCLQFCLCAVVGDYVCWSI